MILGIAEDFTSNIVLDSELKETPSSGMYFNSGIHPSITINNLLQFLPNLDVILDDWASGTTYSVFSSTRLTSDLVSYSNKLYQCILASTNDQPDTSPTYWVETNLDSLRLKNFIYKVQDKIYSDLKLTRRLVDNQYLYEVGETTITLPSDYAGWVFEPKGSDYISLRINEISFQKKSTTPVNLYVINQGVLITTLTITPSNGIVEFKRLDYTFKGRGKWIFAIDATTVESNNYDIDTLKYNGFTAYTTTGVGDTPEGATYNAKSSGNGLGFNISAYIDSSDYITNNLSEFGNYFRSTFEYLAFQMFLFNSNSQINSDQRMMNIDLLKAEVLNINIDSSVVRYNKARKEAMEQLKKTFDRGIGFDDYTIKIGVF